MTCTRSLPALAALTMVLTTSLAAWADVTTYSGTWSGRLTEARVDSTGTTTCSYRRQDQEAWQDHGPFQLGDGAVSFGWDTGTPDRVNFKADLNFGSHATDTHAKVAFLNIKSTQQFFDEVQHIEGTADWDPATRTLTYSHRPDSDDQRDDSSASTVSQSRPPTCDEADSRACKAFFKSTRELEGLVMNLTFSEDLSRFEGDVVLIQFGGSGLERSSTDLLTRMSGTLQAP